MTTILDIGSSKVRRELLRLYFSATDKEHYVRELERMLGFSAGNIRRELLKLTAQGLFISRREANLVYYRLDAGYPLYEELRSIVRKTLGLGASTAADDVSAVAETAAEYAAVADYIAPVDSAGMLKKIEILKPLIAHFCRDNHIKKLALFGSVLRDDFGPHSDVDVLVEFEPGKTPGLEYFGIQDKLSVLLGRPVDLGTPDGLNPYVKDDILESSQVIYDAG